LSNKTTLESVYSQVDVGDSGSLWWKSFTELWVDNKVSYANKIARQHCWDDI